MIISKIYDLIVGPDNPMCCSTSIMKKPSLKDLKLSYSFLMKLEYKYPEIGYLFAQSGWNK